MLSAYSYNYFLTCARRVARNERLLLQCGVLLPLLQRSVRLVLLQRVSSELHAEGVGGGVGVLALARLELMV